MAIAEKTILSPEEPKPGIPLKRSTLIAVVVGVLVLGLMASLLLQGDGGQGDANTPVVKDQNELKQVGNPKVLAEERERALASLDGRPAAQAPRTTEAQAIGQAGADQATQPAGVGPAAATGQSGPVVLLRPSASGLPQGGITPPADVRRTDNSAAIYSQGMRRPSAGPGGVQGQGGGGPGGTDDPELEAQARGRESKPMVLDDSPSPDTGEQRAGAADRRVAAASPFAMPTSAPTPAQAPSAGIASQIDAIRAQLGGQQQQQRSGGWVREYAQESAQGRQMIQWQPSPGSFVLRRGKIIPATTERKINSDLPGAITARVRENVYDSAGNLLIPMGSVLVGRYDSQVRVGQQRVLFAFEDLILPNGVSFRLPAAAGSDVAGAAGVQGDVNNHFLRMFGSSLLIAVLADRTRQPSQVTSIGGTAAIGAAGQVLADTSRVILERNRVIQPTITVDQGTRINVEVAADMAFPGAYPTGSSQ